MLDVHSVYFGGGAISLHDEGGMTNARKEA
jgi:hypothetical protein